MCTNILYEIYLRYVGKYRHNGYALVNALPVIFENSSVGFENPCLLGCYAV